ncbi:ferrous iron transport protein B [Afifella sp. H1R]|uniref:ferrous iron transport protein B n=1 Tax=Afifella sp. H1R TaxID=2908841 RepID=UPI001F25B5ED|nr:ferrous iron transport protein B [Afifella sp. H1R]
MTEKTAGAAGASGRRLRVALAGQQNAGKSTLFNALTGVAQHIANYPGVTVDKKSGFYLDHGRRVEVVDLPGTYSLTSFSLEERVVRRFLYEERPDVVVNVLDASNLRRGLYLTAQLIELGHPLIVVVNMMDVAERRGLKIDLNALARKLKVPVVASIGRKGVGREELRAAIRRIADEPDSSPAISDARLDYRALEETIGWVEERLADSSGLDAGAAVRGLAVKLVEGDAEAVRLVREDPRQAVFLEEVAEARKNFETAHDLSTGDHVAAIRDRFAGEIVTASVRESRKGAVSASERVDRLLLHRILAPIFLVLVVWGIYEISIVQGYELTKVTWPFLASLRNFAAQWLPEAGFLYDPQIRSLGLWMVDSANTLLNYVPIFLILFALIAILEDSGYMARIAFILDRILHRFGLHGQSTLPFILAGVFAGGCAVPGVMATKGIPDERARLATILTVPFMNCLAKIPLYTLLINIYFVEAKGLVLFYLSTITIFAALLVAKLLSVSVLRHKETAPFVMELPHYHLPTLTGVVRRSIDRTWLYIKKVGTVVVAVSVVVYVLLQFPGLSAEQEAVYEGRAEVAIAEFYDEMAGNPYLAAVPDQAALTGLVNVYTDYRTEKLMAQGAEASSAVDARYETRYPDFYPFLKRSSDKEARAAERALKTLATTRKTLRREMKEERIVNSLLGQVGRSLEPVTQFAGFDWKINVALLSSFAARESSVATLGVLFQPSDGENDTLEERMGTEQRAAGYSALGAVALMLFFALYPPCLATTIMVRVQTQSYRWMIFSIVFPTFLGLSVASAVFTLGGMFALSGLETLTITYFTAFAAVILVGLFKRPFGRVLPPPGYSPRGAVS